MINASAAAAVLSAQLLPAAPMNSDTAARIADAARLILPDHERGRRLDALMLRDAMETVFGASDAAGTWAWTNAYAAREAETDLFLRKFGPAPRDTARTEARRDGSEGGM